MKPNLSTEFLQCHGLALPQVSWMTERRMRKIVQGTFRLTEVSAIRALVRPGDRVLEVGSGPGIAGAVAMKSAKAAGLLTLASSPELAQDISAIHDANELGATAKVVHSVLCADTPMPQKLTVAQEDGTLSTRLADTGDDIKTIPVWEVLRRLRPTVMILDLNMLPEGILQQLSLFDTRVLLVHAPTDHPHTKDLESALERAQFERNEAFSDGAYLCLTRDPPDSATDGTEQPDPRGGWSDGIRSFEKAQVIPSPVKPKLSFPAGVLTEEGTPVDSAAVWRRHRRITQRPAAVPVRDRLDGTWLWGGLLYGHFGHFLCESTARLWALPGLEHDLTGVLFTSKFDASQNGISSYHRDFIDLVAPRMPVHVVTHPTRVERLIVPGQGFGLGRMAEGTATYRQSMRTHFARDVAPEGGPRLYISRSGLGPRKGGFILETRLEAHLADQGYEIFHPQDHDLRKQIARYKAATHILAAEGSALHLLGMVANPTQSIGVLCRRKATASTAFSTQIAAFTGRFPHMFEALNRFWMPANGGASHVGIAELDLPVLQRALQAKGFVDAGSAWPKITEGDAREAIQSTRFWRINDYQPNG